MKVGHLYPILCMLSFGEAGPVIAAIAAVAGPIAGDAAATAIASTSVAAICGVGASGIWYGSIIITNAGLFIGSAAVGVGVIGGKSKTRSFTRGRGG